MKNKERRLWIIDKIDRVDAFLHIDGEPCLDYLHEESKDVRIRSPIPTKEGLLDTANIHCKHDRSITSPTHFLKLYVESQDRMIFESIQEIRKQMKKLSRCKQRISLANKIIEEINR